MGHAPVIALWWKVRDVRVALILQSGNRTMISGNNLEAVPCETLRAVFSIREAADALGTSPRVVRSLVAAGALEGLRLGTGHVRVTRISGASVRRFATGANG